MKHPDTQLAMDVEDPKAREREVAREVADQRLLLERFFAACREVCLDQTYEVVAVELERVWGDLGRHVSTGVLKSALSQSDPNRNYFRWEWCIWFARHSEHCAELLAEIIGRGKPKKTPEQELADLKSVIRNEYPRQAERLIRKGETS
jgi:hypothetical protein